MLLTGIVALHCLLLLALGGCVPAAHIIHGSICQALKAAAIRKRLCLLHDGLDALESLPGGGPQLDFHLQAAAHTRGQRVRQVVLTAAVSQDVWSSALQLRVTTRQLHTYQGSALHESLFAAAVSPGTGCRGRQLCQQHLGQPWRC